MIRIARPQPLDRYLTPGVLQQAMALWVHLFHITRDANRAVTPSYCAVAVEIWGFPRADGPAFRQELLDRAAAIGLTQLRFEFVDPDNLRIDGPICFTQPLPDFTTWFALCVCEPVENLVCTFRLTVKDSPEAGETVRHRGNTLVLVGQPQQSSLLLKAIWPSGSDRRYDYAYKFAAWPNEKDFLDLLWAPHERIETPPAWAKSAFAPHSGTWTEKVLMWFIFRKDRKLGGFLARLGASALVSTLSLAMIVRLSGSNIVMSALLIGPVFLAASAGLIFQVWLRARMLGGFRHRMREGFKKLYSSSISFPAVNLDEMGARTDPTTRKFSADLEAAGAVHVADVRVEPPIQGQRYTRLYLLADRTICVAFSPMHGGKIASSFPAQPVMLLKTYLSDGTQIVTTNTRMGFRKPLPLPYTMVSRAFPDAESVEAVMANHEQVLRRHATTDRVPVDPDGVIQRMIDEHEVARPLMAQRDYYGWGDAFRETFDIVRREYRD